MISLYNVHILNNDINKEKIDKIVRDLRELKPGYLPFKIFQEICRLTVTSIIEFVPLRKLKDTFEVLLLKRDEDDPFWPDAYHIPGVVVLATDENLQETFDRIINGELKEAGIQGEPAFVKYLFRRSKRGTELCLLYWVLVRSETKVGKWFKLDSLPEELIGEQIPNIKAAVRSCRNYCSIICKCE